MFCEPIGDVVAPEAHVVGANMFHATFAIRENLEFTIALVDVKTQRTVLVRMVKGVRRSEFAERLLAELPTP